MKLLLVTFDPPENVGGIEGRVRGYVRELPKIGVYPEVLALAGDFSYEKSSYEGSTMYRVSSRMSRFPRSVGEVGRLLTAGSYDSVFLLSGATTLVGNFILLRCRLTGVRTGVLFYGKDVLQARRRLVGRFLLLASVLLSNRVLANSRFTSSLLPAFAGSKSVILYPTVDPNEAGAQQPTPAGSRRILFVGRLVKRKGVGDLIDAFSIVETTLPGCALDIVGDGPERQNLENLVSDLGLTSKVTFHGSLRGEALYSKYRSCDIVVMPSTRTPDDVEGFGTVFLEAALFSKPSVGTRSGGIPEAVNDGTTGLLVPESDVRQLAEAITRLLKDGELRTRLGRNAQARTLQYFTWARSARVLADALRSERLPEPDPLLGEAHP